MQIRLSDVIAVAAGVMLFDFALCTVVRLFPPKPLNCQRFGAFTSERKSSCHCGGGCDSCAKNITDRSQVIDMTEIRSQGVNVSV